MGHNDQAIEIVTSFVQLHPPHLTTTIMKFVLAFVALASVAAVNAAPGTFFKDAGMTNIEDVQVNLKKIKLAGDDIEVTEGLLSTLNDNAGTINTATELLTTAADVGVYTGTDVEFTHESQS